MKNLYFTTFCLLFLFFNCTNDNELLEKDNISLTVESSYRVNKVLEITDKNEKKVAYSLLDKEEKFFLWDNKFDVLINNNELYGANVELNDKQKELLIEVRDKLNLDFFDENQNDTKEYIKNIFVPEFINRATKVFPNSLIVGLIFYEISVPLTKTDLYKTNTSATKNDISIEDLQTAISLIDDNNGSACNCAKTSFFSCSWGQHEDYCKPKKCNLIRDCGFMWGFMCDGDCQPL